MELDHPFQPTYAPGIDRQEKYGIYRWDVEGVGTYIGKFTHPSRPTIEYSRNVNRLLAGGIYRPSSVNGWRPIHRALELAVRHGLQVTLTITEIHSAATYAQREKVLIAELGTLNGHRGRKTVLEAAERLSPAG